LGPGIGEHVVAEVDAGRRHLGEEAVHLRRRGVVVGVVGRSCNRPTRRRSRPPPQRRGHTRRRGCAAPARRRERTVGEALVLGGHELSPARSAAGAYFLTMNAPRSEQSASSGQALSCARSAHSSCVVCRSVSPCSPSWATATLSTAAAVPPRRSRRTRRRCPCSPAAAAGPAAQR
jgi:hypothetical protein